ncbi:DUF2797 domain-containing protein [Ancylomarina euxinus]|uniref:DUF2797 domain-containing protein n=2 Tax=Ancylomarina euxinus TaxID=2283627 RepID=A0A425Y7S8_9BACT|nr:DUF2797 domain-containing protein [Ancylomarina euxinus]RRG24571.1 DUF2797 domain-containing protein [Ancylomarina euxinus]
MLYKGNILKMRTQLKDVITYELPIGDDFVDMNTLIGKKLTWTYLHQINCVHCGKKTKTSFSQGYCYTCFTSLPQTDASIMNPELDESHLGISRDMEWSKSHSLKPHYVYLAFSSNLKVGVTRESQIPTRWIDQGAVAAIKLAKTPNRHIAGIIEVALKEHFADKTNWKAMLKNEGELSVDLKLEKGRAIELLHPELQQYVCAEDEAYELNYPVEQYPQKITSFSFDKVETYEGTLKGIKGQYLIFDEGKVINIRKHNGYFVELKV